MREGLRAARGHRVLDHNDRPPPIIWNKVGVLTNQHPVLDQPLPGLEVLFQAHPPFHFAFPSVSVSGTHLPAPRTGIAQALRSGPCCREPGRDPGLRAPGGRRGESWSRQHGPQGLSPPRAAAARVGVCMGYHSPRDALGHVPTARSPSWRHRTVGIHGLWGRTEGLGVPRLRVHAPKSRLSDLGTGYTRWDRRANPYLRVFSLAPWEESDSYVG